MRGSRTDYEGASLGMATETRTAETEQVTSAEMEEDRTYVIGGVLEKSSGSMVSLLEAIEKGLVVPAEGVYVDGGRKMPIPEAMTKGWIKVVGSSVRRGKERFSSVGIITIRTVKETIRAYVVEGVVDTETGEMVEGRQAVERGLLDENEGWVLDAKANKKMLISDAAELGLAKLDYAGEAAAPEVVVKSYVVRAAVDTAAKKTVAFDEAVARGIIDVQSGAFRDSRSGERMYVGEAIMRGFLKARLLGEEDEGGLMIDPCNKMVVEKTKKIRSKLLNPLRVISAFKMAADKKMVSQKKEGGGGKEESV